MDEFENKFNNDKQIANAFNSYFINTSQSINNQFTSPINNINPINITPISKSIYLHPTSTHEIKYYYYYITLTHRSTNYCLPCIIRGHNGLCLLCIFQCLMYICFRV